MSPLVLSVSVEQRRTVYSVRWRYYQINVFISGSNFHLQVGSSVAGCILVRTPPVAF